MQNSMVQLHFFCFRREIPFLRKFGPKNQSCQFKLKFGTYFFSFKPEIPFLGKFGPKLQCNFIEIALLHGCSSVNLLHICRTLEHLKSPASLNTEAYQGPSQHLDRVLCDISQWLSPFN